VLRDPDPRTARYREHQVLGRGDVATIEALPGARVAVADLLPPP
jgi:hypothetical protein